MQKVFNFETIWTREKYHPANNEVKRRFVIPIGYTKMGGKDFFHLENNTLSCNNDLLIEAL